MQELKCKIIKYEYIVRRMEDKPPSFRIIAKICEIPREECRQISAGR